MNERVAASMDGMDDEKPDIFVVTCPKCGFAFQLRWDSEPFSLNVRWCQSAGIYAVDIKCPRCRHKEDLM